MNVEKMLMSSNFFANKALMNPPKEKSNAVKKLNRITTSGCSTTGCTKNTDTAKMMTATSNPRNIPPAQNPAKITHAGVGETMSSSTFFWNFDPKNEETTFVNELVIMPIIMSPGTMNDMYEMPFIFFICEPMNPPKMMK